jgi:AraC family transcriptional regulator
MHALEQIQKTIVFIEDHLSDDISIENLAKMASLSPFYYQRLFSRLVKKPVAEYVKLRRMARATESLLQKEKRILDIALDLGFSSHEHFSRTFKDTFGMTPDEYRKNPQALNRMTKPELLLHYTLIEEGMPVEFIDRLGTESGVDPLDTLWRSFHQQKATMPGIFVDNEEIGVAYPCIEEGYFSYFAGAKSRQEEAPDALVSWELPLGEYIVCSFDAENFDALVMDALYKAQQYIYNTLVPNHKLLI